MLYSESSKKTEKYATPVQQVFKRPHGVAVQCLRDLFLTKEGDSDEKEFTLKVTPKEINNSTRLTFNAFLRYFNVKKRIFINYMNQ